MAQRFPMIAGSVAIALGIAAMVGAGTSTAQEPTPEEDPVATTEIPPPPTSSETTTTSSDMTTESETTSQAPPSVPTSPTTPSETIDPTNPPTTLPPTSTTSDTTTAASTTSDTTMFAPAPTDGGSSHHLAATGSPLPGLWFAGFLLTAFGVITLLLARLIRLETEESSRFGQSHLRAN